MSEIFLLVSKGAFAAAGCFAGVRLAQGARQQGRDGLQRRASVMILVGGAGLLGFGLGPLIAPYSAELARSVMLLCDGLERLALLLLAWFVWHVFGGSGALRNGLLASIVAILCLDWAQMLSAQQWPETRLPVFVDATSQLAFATPFLWSMTEAGREYRRSRRRQTLGLTDASVTNRFFLWAFATGCLALVCLTTALLKLVAEMPTLVAALQYTLALTYSVVAGAILMGFWRRSSGGKTSAAAADG